MKKHEHNLTKLGEWSPVALHGTHEHDEATEWMIFRLDPTSPIEDGDIVPVGSGGLTFFEAKTICDEHNQDLKNARE